MRHRSGRLPRIALKEPIFLAERSPGYKGEEVQREAMREHSSEVLTCTGVSLPRTRDRVIQQLYSTFLML